MTKCWATFNLSLLKSASQAMMVLGLFSVNPLTVDFNGMGCNLWENLLKGKLFVWQV